MIPVDRTHLRSARACRHARWVRRHGVDRAREIQQDPRSGALLIFTNARRDRIKALWWVQNGYCILYKRFHKAMFELPIAGEVGAVAVRIDGQKLAQLLAGVRKSAQAARNSRRALTGPAAMIICRRRWASRSRIRGSDRRGPGRCAVRRAR